MVKYGRQFASGLTSLKGTSTWAHIDYKYYKGALRAMLSASANDSGQPLVLSTADDFSALVETDGVLALDATFRRSLLSDITEVDACFVAQCQELRGRMNAGEANESCRASLLELHRWAALNYLAVLKIVKKHDKSGVLRPLHAEAVQ